MLTRMLVGIAVSVVMAAPALGDDLLVQPLKFEQSRGVSLFVDDLPYSSWTTGDAGDGVGGGAGGSGGSITLGGFLLSHSVSVGTEFFIPELSGAVRSADRVRLTSRASIGLNPFTDQAGKVAGIATTNHSALFRTAVEPVSFRLAGTITVDAMATGGALSEVFARVSLDESGLSGFEYFFEQRFTESAVIPIDVTGSFAGDFSSVSLRTGSFAYGLADTIDAEATSSVRIELTLELFPIPSPGALPLFACAGLLAGRRRRRGATTTA